MHVIPLLLEEFRALISCDIYASTCVVLPSLGWSSRETRHNPYSKETKDSLFRINTTVSCRMSLPLCWISFGYTLRVLTSTLWREPLTFFYSATLSFLYTWSLHPWEQMFGSEHTSLTNYGSISDHSLVTGVSTENCEAMWLLCIPASWRIRSMHTPTYSIHT